MRLRKQIVSEYSEWSRILLLRANLEMSTKVFIIQFILNKKRTIELYRGVPGDVPLERRKSNPKLRVPF